MLRDDKISSILNQAPEPTRWIDAAAIRATTAYVGSQSTDNRRRRLVLILASVTAVIFLAVATAIIPRTAGSQHRAVPAGSAARSSFSTTMKTSAHSASGASGHTAATIGVCRGDQLHATSFRRGSVASAPFVVVRFTLVGSVPCSVTGRPTVKISSSRHVAISQHAGTYEVPDMPASPVVIEAATSAYITIGTSTASEGSNEMMYDIKRLEFHFAHQQGSTILDLTAPLGTITKANMPIMMGVTSATVNAQ